MTTCKGRVRHGTKGGFTSLTPVPWKAGCMPPWPDLRMMATGISRGSADQGDYPGDPVLLVSPLDSHPQIVSLRRCH